MIKYFVIEGKLHMDVIEAMRTRRSTRVFRSGPVPRELVESVIAAAINAPSANNLQPWEITVVAGKEKERLSRALLKAYREKNISCGSGAVKPLPAAARKRAADTKKAMNAVLEQNGLNPEAFVNEGSCNFYGAPVAVILSLDDCYSFRQMVDAGTFVGYFVLAAHELGLGSCPVGLIDSYVDEIKEFLNIPENKKVVIGLALGYADEKSPVNAFKSGRANISDLVRWY
jgi:nitroreductase